MSANGTTALDAANWGTSTGGAAGAAETTSTLGVDRLDVRVPPDTTRIWGAQINACKNLLISMSQHFLGGTRLKMLTQSANPFGASEGGFWTDGTNAKFTNASGTTITLGSGANGLLGAYQGASATSQNILTFTSALGPVILRDNATPLGGTLFGVQNSAGSTKYVDVTSNGVAATQYSGTVYTQTFSATPTFTASNGETQLITLTANITSYTVSAGLNGQILTIIFIQDATGSRTLAGTPGNVKLASGGLTLSTAANARDSLTLRYDSTNSVWQEVGRGLQSSTASVVGLKGAYNAGNSSADEIIPLTSTLSSVLIRDNSTPIGTTLFGVQNNGGSTKFLDVTTNGVQATQYFGTVFTVTFSATPTFTASNGETQLITLTANITSYTVSAGQGGQLLTIIFIQDATGSRTLAGTPSNVKLSGGAFTLSTAANARDSITFRYDSTNSIWEEVGRKTQAAAAGSGTVTGTGTSTQVAFWSGASALTSDSALYWDNTNKRLSINAGSSPSFKLDILGVASGGSNDFQLRVKGGTSSAGQIAIDTTSTNFQAAIQFASAGTTKWQIGKQTDDTLFLWDSANSRDILECASGNMRLCPAGGNVIVGASGTPSYMLDVHGTGGVTGLLTLTGGITGTGSTSWDFHGSSASFLTSSGANQLNGLTTLQPSASTSGSPTLFTISGPAHTTLTDAEDIDVNFNLARTVQFTGSSSAGAANIATVRSFLIQPPTYAFSSTGAQVIATGATVAISGPPAAGSHCSITTATPLLIDNDGIANNTKPGVVLQNTTAATSGASTQQWSPAVQLTGHQYNGSVDKVVDWAIQHRPVSGKTNGGDLVFFSQYDAGGWTEQMTIQQNGTNTALELVLGGGSSPNVTFSGGATCLAAYFCNRSDGSQNFVSVGSTSVTFSAVGSGSSTYTMDGTGFWPTQTDKSYQLGTSSKRFTQIWGYQHCGVVQTVADAASITVDPTAGETVRITLGSTAITTVTVNNGQPGQLMTIEVIQDGTGSRSISGWSSNVKFAGGAAPTWTTTASKRDLVTFRWDSTDSNWYEVARSQNM